MSKDTEGKQQAERATRQVSEETRAKLSESMRQHWNRKRASEAAIMLHAKEATSPTTIMRLFTAARALSDGNDEKDAALLAAVITGVRASTICHGLAHSQVEGTNLQARLAQRLRDFITEEMP